MAAVGSCHVSGPCYGGLGACPPGELSADKLPTDSDDLGSELEPEKGTSGSDDDDGDESVPPPTKKVCGQNVEM